ncbi:MAG: DUF5686 and carboxypeptidase regulatory-like domain-containing protein [Reichenbachiella sp.]
MTDATTGETLPFVNISFNGTTLGTVSDMEGKFYIETSDATNQLKASYIGYDAIIKPVNIGAIQTINFSLVEKSLELDNVVVSGKKLRYKNKGNPAVKVIQKVIEHKDDNIIGSLDYYEYNKYEKVEFDFNNISEKFMQRRVMKDFQMIFDYMDTSDINGKTYLPVFLRETNSDVYYRKNPKRYVEYRRGVKMTGFEEYFDNQGISFAMDKIYQDVDIYQNNMNVLSQMFVSPISILATSTYKYYIADTLVIDGEKLYKLSFQPRNANSLAFVGNMFVTTDSAYAIKQISMQIADDVNLNYVSDLFVDQEFEKNEEGKYIKTFDKLSMDFNVLDNSGVGIFAKRSVSYGDHIYNVPREDSVYAGLNTIVEIEENQDRPDEYWESIRHEELTDSEKDVYEMTQEIEKLPAFHRTMDIITLLTIGYLDKGPFAIGPVGTFYSWNEIEGMRLRFGGMTNRKFSEHWELSGYGAYGVLDEEWKYSGIVTYYWDRNPLHAIQAQYQKDINNPGEDLQYVPEDNFLLSFKRGVNDKKIYYSRTKFDYYKEVDYGITFTAGVKQQDLQPGGILSFAPGVIDPSIKDQEQREAQEIKTTEATLGIRFAPNQKYYVSRTQRIPIPDKNPVFNLRYWHGFEDVLGADYSYDRLQLGMNKRFYVAPFGYTDFYLIGTKLWGTVPYPLLTIPRANQTYSYQVKSYNMMNYLEFVSDMQLEVQLQHSFNGFIMNKIPLIKKLKLRSFVTYKMVYGTVSDKNDPDLNNELPPFPVNPNGVQATYAMSNKPYMEASVGLSNIFKVLRVDLVKRITYLEQPDVPQGYVIRAMLNIEF